MTQTKDPCGNLQEASPWDGVSTYDPVSGTIQIGRYADGTPARWQLHDPGRGAASGVLAGTMCTGKTSALRIIAAETMQVRVCTFRGACTGCELRPAAVAWLADPLQQALGDFGGRAGLLAWGPYATVHMLIMMRAGIRARAARFGDLAWTDHLGRENTGLGSFDPAPGRPLVTGLVDDWQQVTGNPELTWLGRWAAATIAGEGPRAGAGLTLAVPSLDWAGCGDLSTARNVLCGRTDGLAGPGMGIQGDPSTLPRLPGAGYLAGPDARPGEVMRATYLPGFPDGSQAGPGTGGAPAGEHASLDEDFLSAVVPLGYTGPGQVLTGEPMKAALEFQAAAGAGRDIEDALRHVTAQGRNHRPARTRRHPVMTGPATPATPAAVLPPAAVPAAAATELAAKLTSRDSGATYGDGFAALTHGLLAIAAAIQDNGNDTSGALTAGPGSTLAVIAGAVCPRFSWGARARARRAARREAGPWPSA